MVALGGNGTWVRWLPWNGEAAGGADPSQWRLRGMVAGCASRTPGRCKKDPLRGKILNNEYSRRGI